MLQVENLCKRFGAIQAVSGLSFNACKGEILGLLGPNGAGKSTCINMVAGLLNADSGDINVGGLGSPVLPEVRQNIGVAPQALALYQGLTGEENLRYFGRLAGLSGKALRDRVSWTLDFVLLTDRKNDRVKTYSGGMQRRINLAAALVHDPPLLLLDEPTVGVDPQSRNALFDNVLALKGQGRTVIYTTHYMEEAERLCDRVGIIDHGEFLAFDTVDKLIETHGGRSMVTVVRHDGQVKIESDDPISECVRLQQEGEIISLRIDRPDLERVFLNLTGRAMRD